MTARFSPTFATHEALDGLEHIGPTRPTRSITATAGEATSPTRTRRTPRKAKRTIARPYTASIARLGFRNEGAPGCKSPFLPVVAGIASVLHFRNPSRKSHLPLAVPLSLPGAVVQHCTLRKRLSVAPMVLYTENIAIIGKLGSMVRKMPSLKDMKTPVFPNGT